MASWAESRRDLTSKRIYVDLDDVLAETGRMFLEVLGRDFGRQIEFEQVVDYDLGESLNLSPIVLEEFMRAVHEPPALASIRPMPGAKEALTGWVEAGYEVEVVTGRPVVTREVSQRWLDAIQMPHHGLTFVKKYVWSKEMFSEDGAVPLSGMIDSGFRLIVEDSAEVAVRLAELLEAPIVLLDRPWNRHRTDSQEAVGRIQRCGNWQEIKQRFPQP